MHFCHSQRLWQEFPQLVPGLLVVGGIHAQVEAEARLQPWFERARERLSQGAESGLPEISAWRRAYAQMGLKPTQYRSAAEALLRRFRREDDLPRLHPLIDLCNAVSLAFALPVAVFDLARVDTYLEVRHAVSPETGRVLIVSEGLHDTAGADVPALIDALAGEVAGLWSSPQQQAILSAATPRLEFA